MTDGIIQQVISNYATTKIPHISFRDAKILSELQQELIEKIRQWDIDNRGYYPYHISLKDLIGDNKQ